MATMPDGERRILDIMQQAADIPAISTSAAVREAFKHFSIGSVVVVTPYPKNDDILFYLDKIGIRVVCDVALNLPSVQYGVVTPLEWHDVAVKNDQADADAIFLSCAATTQIDAVAPLEATLGKPVVNSNQAVLWASLMHAPRTRPTAHRRGAGTPRGPARPPSTSRRAGGGSRSASSGPAPAR